MKLIKPTLKYKKSFFEGLKELQKVQEDGFSNNIGNSSVEEYVRFSKNYEKGKNLPQGWVPYTTYWLIDKDDFIGEASIRHILTDNLRKIGGHIGYSIRPSKRRKGYGKKILELVLKKAKKLKLGKILITCDETNIGSKKIIEENGGILEKVIKQEGRKPKKLLYWINT